MLYTYAIRFQTSLALVQSAGMEFWAAGDSFAQDGSRTYVFTGAVSAVGPLSAAERALELISEILEKVYEDRAVAFEVLSLSVVVRGQTMGYRQVEA